ncbi:MAG: c-type cytochrome [Enterobacterales bacterium]|nr:c-type cytochrome [Enterobacterales bacterium]
MSSNVLAGDAAAGQKAYAICSACHGQMGEGNEVFKAPKIAGQHAWYTVAALKDYKDGKRTGPMAGTMTPMASMLNEQQMADLAAYIATL